LRLTSLADRVSNGTQKKEEEEEEEEGIRGSVAP